jgi:hypothetical protein
MSQQYLVEHKGGVIGKAISGVYGHSCYMQGRACQDVAHLFLKIVQESRGQPFPTAVKPN